jgi:protein-disulfide isomerase
MNAIHLDILTSPNCPYSPKAVRVAQKVVLKGNIPVLLREISVATQEGEDIAEAFHIDSTPTFAINGKIAFVGVPAPDVLSGIILDEIKRERERTNYFF